MTIVVALFSWAKIEGADKATCSVTRALEFSRQTHRLGVMLRPSVSNFRYLRTKWRLDLKHFFFFFPIQECFHPTGIGMQWRIFNRKMIYCSMGWGGGSSNHLPAPVFLECYLTAGLTVWQSNSLMGFRFAIGLWSSLLSGYNEAVKLRC